MTNTPTQNLLMINTYNVSPDKNFLKTSDLLPIRQDLFMLAGIVDGIVGGSSWGTITGTLSNQTDLQNALNAKSGLASPAFTGTPTGPTAAVGTNTTQLATTAFVLANGSGGITGLTAGYIPVAATATTIANSALRDSGTQLSYLMAPATGTAVTLRGSTNDNTAFVLKTFALDGVTNTAYIDNAGNFYAKGLPTFAGLTVNRMLLTGAGGAVSSSSSKIIVIDGYIQMSGPDTSLYVENTNNNDHACYMNNYNSRVSRLLTGMPATIQLDNTYAATGTVKILATLNNPSTLTNGGGSALSFSIAGNHRAYMEHVLYDVTAGVEQGRFNFLVMSNGALVSPLTMVRNKVGIGMAIDALPLSLLQLGAGTATANTAPVQLTNGTRETTARVGLMEFENNWYHTNNSLVRYALGGVINDFYTDVNSPAATTETDLYTYTTLANTLNVNGDKVDAEYGLQLTSTGGVTKQIRAYFAGTLIFDTGTLSISASTDFCVDIFVVRDSATTVRCIVKANTTGAATNAYAKVTKVTGLTLSNTNILKVTGTVGAGAVIGDIKGICGMVEIKGAA